MRKRYRMKKKVPRKVRTEDWRGKKGQTKRAIRENGRGKKKKLLR